MSKPNVKTRNSTQTTLIGLVGQGKVFIPSEVPTWRAIFQYGILLQKTKLLEDGGTRANYPVEELSDDIATKVIEQWTLANSKFCPPVTVGKRGLAKKISRRWAGINKVARGKATAAEKSKAVRELDTLCDICVCQHEINLCNNSDVKCSGCRFQAHIQCNCAKDIKVPQNELYWLYYQRLKTSEKSSIQIGHKDLTENKKEEIKFKNVCERRKRSETMKDKEEAERNKRFKMIKLEEESEEENLEDQGDEQKSSTSQRYVKLLLANTCYIIKVHKILDNKTSYCKGYRKSDYLQFNYKHIWRIII